MSRFVNDLPIGPNNVQIGLVTFGSTAHNEFFLNQYNDKQSTLSAIQKATYVSGTTATGEALQMIRQQHLLPSHGARNVSKHYYYFVDYHILPSHVALLTSCCISCRA
jgi:uncharacterized protein YegL